MSIQESAIAYHDNGFNCAQSVLAALQEGRIKAIKYIDILPMI